MKKRNNIYVIVIIVLVALLVTVSLLLLLEKMQGPVIKYKDYQDDMIHVQKVNGFDSMVSIIDDYVILLLSSNTEDGNDIVATATFYNDQEEKLSTVETGGVISNKGRLLLFFAVPDIGDDYAGKVDIKLSVEDTAVDDIVDVSKITYQETHEVDENTKGVKVYITGINGNDYGVLSFFTNVVAVKNHKIVDYNSIYFEDVASGATFDSSFELAAVADSGKPTPIEFDELYVFASDAQKAN